MVAAVCTWHERHAAAAEEIGRRLARGERLASAAPALIETYAVLTRLPAPHRLSPADAWSLVNANFLEGATIVALTGAAIGKLLGRLAAQDIGGDRTYDAMIGECACRSRADVLLTFNRRHFEPPPAGVAVIQPA